jgi:hypothetical protein
MKTALSHREPDRVPISDFFWGGFIRRWRQELNLPADANPYYYYDLDWIVTVPKHCHQHGLMVIYHGCGNVQAVIDDFVEIGVDAYNPLEVKAGMDAVDLRRRLGHSIGFCGNSDVISGRISRRTWPGWRPTRPRRNGGPNACRARSH